MMVDETFQFIVGIDNANVLDSINLGDFARTMVLTLSRYDDLTTEHSITVNLEFCEGEWNLVIKGPHDQSLCESIMVATANNLGDVHFLLNVFGSDLKEIGRYTIENGACVYKATFPPEA